MRCYQCGAAIEPSQEHMPPLLCETCHAKAVAAMNERLSNADKIGGTSCPVDPTGGPASASISQEKKRDGRVVKKATPLS